MGVSAPSLHRESTDSLIMCSQLTCLYVHHNPHTEGHMVAEVYMYVYVYDYGCGYPLDFLLQLTHIKIGDFPGKVLLPSKLFKPRGKVHVHV